MIRAGLAYHNELAEPQDATPIRARLSQSMAGLAPAAPHQLAVDLRLDGQVSLPQHVLDEAARAAGVLLRVSTQPFGSTAWLDGDDASAAAG